MTDEEPDYNRYATIVTKWVVKEEKLKVWISHLQGKQMDCCVARSLHTGMFRLRRVGAHLHIRSLSTRYNMTDPWEPEEILTKEYKEVENELHEQV